MSNCIQILNGCIELNTYEFDIQGYKALLERVKDLKDAPNPATDQAGYCAYWWLGNSVFLRDGHNVVIGLGHGRSRHTFRDFKGTLLVLAKLMKRPKIVNIRYVDTDDGRDQKCWVKINLKVGWPEPPPSPPRKWTFTPIPTPSAQ